MKYNKKTRGNKRKISLLLNYINEFKPFNYMTEKYEHFHVPCAYGFINNQKTNSKIKTTFCKEWIKATEKFIKQKPKHLSFCKVVSFICLENLWESQIIIFYDEQYYNSFFNRKTKEQHWKQIDNKSFVQNRNIKTSLKEVCYIETINIKEDNFYNKNTLWFYGEL